MPVLFQVVLPFERLAAHFARVGDVIAMTALVDHQIVGLGETTLAVLADKIGSRCHPAPVGGTPVLGVVGHHSEHFQLIVLSFFTLIKRPTGQPAMHLDETVTERSRKLENSTKIVTAGAEAREVATGEDEEHCASAINTNKLASGRLSFS